MIYIHCMTNTSDPQVEHLPFRPLWGLASPHVQTVVSLLLSTAGPEPPFSSFPVSLDDGDILHCMLSTPPTWTNAQKTVLLIHGLGGSHASGYMIRLSRKFYEKGFRILRINLRGVGTSAGLVQRPYHGGTSHDVLQVVQAIKNETPTSPLVLIGFSLGGNIALKLAGELEEKGIDLLDQIISVCAPIDLEHATTTLLNSSNRLYNQYYVKGLKQLGDRWIGKQPIRNIIDFDHAVTAPQWGFKDAFDYYRQCSSCFLLPKISVPCNLIFCADDPFIDYRAALKQPLCPTTKISLSQHGGHMGFLGWAGPEHRYFWLDHHLLSLVGFAD